MKALSALGQINAEDFGQGLDKRNPTWYHHHGVVLRTRIVAGRGAKLFMRFTGTSPGQMSPGHFSGREKIVLSSGDALVFNTPGRMSPGLFNVRCQPPPRRHNASGPGQMSPGIYSRNDSV